MKIINQMKFEEKRNNNQTAKEILRREEKLSSKLPLDGVRSVQHMTLKQCLFISVTAD